MSTEHMSKAELIRTKGWFSTPGRPGDRTLEQQMTGLEQLLAEVPGKTVIDVGCAEGLISMELCRAGAAGAVGLEIVPYHVNVGRDLVGDLPVSFILANLNNFDLTTLEPADIVIALAVLHKVKDPSAVCAAIAALAKDLCVIRLPPSGTTIVDARSDNVPHDIAGVMEAAGFALETVVEGPLSEWLGYYRRKPVAQDLPQDPHQALPASTETTPAGAETKTEESGSEQAKTESEAAIAASEATQTASADAAVHAGPQTDAAPGDAAAAQGKSVAPITSTSLHEQTQATARGRGGRGSRGK